MQGYVKLGTNVETDHPVWIGDIQRCGGVYLLGRARTGKSNSLISMALQDIERGIGLVFVDPHADAIQAILDRLPGHRLKDVMLLDPTDNDFSFSINPLFCANPHNLQERQLTFAQAWELFAKVFEEDERLGILLRKYLGNCLYPLIEHQGYTLYDLWYFLTDESFRESVLSTVTYHPEVVEFWHVDYNNMLPRQKQEEPRSLLNRIASLRLNPYIKHVISQTGSGIDFVEVMAKQKIVLVRLPPWQDPESRTFIGTLVISQLLKAIFLRAEVAEHLRTPFALYCDEFQLFATPDFAKVFTQTGKYLLMPTVGHQDRYGQFKPNDPNRGATLAAPVKMLFRISVPDSQEIAPEIAKDSPTETKRERLYVISQNPVEDILRGHANPTIQGFVREYLRSLSHRLEDTEAAKEGERIKRQMYLDGAGLMRTTAQLLKEDLRNPAYWRFGAVLSALNSVLELQQKAQGQNAKLLELFKSTQALRQLMRNLDSFLTAIMEARIAKGQEAYARFLIELLSVFFPISPPLALFIALEYGDSSMSRVIHFEIARRSGLYREDVAGLLRQADERTQQKRRELQEHYRLEDERSKISEIEGFRYKLLSNQAETRKKIGESIRGYKGKPGRYLWHIKAIYMLFVWLESDHRLRTILTPYSSARFKARSIHFGLNDRPGDADSLIAYLSSEFNKDPRYNHHLRYMSYEFRSKLFSFMRTYKEGAFVMFALLDVAKYDKGWKEFRPSYGGPYLNLCMRDFPQIDLLDPIETLRLIQSINDVIRYPLPMDYDFFARSFGWKQKILPKLLTDVGILQQPSASAKEHLSKVYEVMDRYYPPERYRDRSAPPLDTAKLIREFEQRSNNDTRPAASDLKRILADRWATFSRQYPSAASGWRHADDLTRSYLIARACDVACFGQEIANLTFPLPKLSWAEEFVSAIVKIIEGFWVPTPAELERQDVEYWRRRHAPKRSRELASISYSPPETLSARLPSESERTELKNACLAELSGSSVLTVLNDFVGFCDLLARPENHVQVPSTQYIETQVNVYSTQEMINQAAKELTRLPRGIAYATVLQDVNDTQIVQTVKIQTYRIAEAKTLIGVGEIVKKNAIEAGILRKRSDIDREIIMRQAKRGRGMDNDPSPPTDAAGDKPPALTSGRPTRKSVPPPATHYIPSHISKQQQVYADDGGQLGTSSEKLVTPSVRQEKSVQQDNIQGVYPMANNRSSTVSPAPIPAPLPSQDREPNRGEGYQIRPFYLCVDVSGSMGAVPQEGSPTIIDLINDDLTSVLQVIHEELEISEVIKMAMVTFAETATVVLPLSNLDTVEAMPTLQATGNTSYLQPLRKLREVIAADFQNRAPHRWFRPVVFFISDGYPNVETEAEWQAARDDLLDPGWGPHPIFTVFGFGNAKADVIRTLASGQKYTGLSCFAPEGQSPRSQLKRIIETVQLTIVSTAKNPEQFGMEVPEGFILLSRPGEDDLG